MPNDADFKELENRVAELTQRIYRLEQQLPGAKPAPAQINSTAAPSHVAPPYPVLPSTETFTPPPVLPSVATQPPPKPVPPRDLESRIGSQWLNRIGILAMMIGAAYFLKLAFDNEWIGPTGRVAIGLLAGIGLVAWSSRVHRRGYKYFSYSLTALGIGIMYLSLWAAFQLYQLIPAPVAFAAMIAVTASAATLAIRQNAQILAAVAIAGGFSTPALLSTGQDRPFVLFSYIALLNIFAIVLVAMRPWRRLLLGSFIGTIIFYVGWYLRFGSHNEENSVAAGFATLFFLQFAILPLIKHLHSFGDNTWHSSKSFVVVALFNPAVYFLELFAIYEFIHRSALSWVAVGLGAFYIVLSKQLTDAQSPATDAEGIGPLHRWLHLAIAVAFLTIAIPLKLHSHWVTMGWFVESAVLLWIGERAHITFLRRIAVVALALGVVRMLFFDDFATSSTLFFNSRFATYVVALAVLSMVAFHVHKEFGATHAGFTIVTICFNALALIALSYEISDYFARQHPEVLSRFGSIAYGQPVPDWTTQRDFAYSALWMLYGAALVFVGFWRKSQVLRWQALFLIAATIAKVFLSDLSNLSGPWRVMSFIALGALLMGISFVYQKDWLKLSGKAE